MSAVGIAVLVVLVLFVLAGTFAFIFVARRNRGGDLPPDATTTDGQFRTAEQQARRNLLGSIGGREN
ncbi:MAG: hypothetical protein UY63_C0009G0020 [Parcubacteria group bacterium GW2011_GWA2_51_10]|nr:MAG: hypothetical protein UY63_C0009G0020 [Parcubacteria group bacterium GW2011_GWA2_51_10]